MMPNRGQAVTELAVFGAILIFLIGGIVRTAVTNAYQQNQQIKAMRQAMGVSLSGQSGNGNESAARNSASITYIEDRLSPDLDKYGPTDRIQFFANGSGTMTNMLFFPVQQEDIEQAKNIPVMDMFINKIHYIFTTASMVSKATTQPPNGLSRAYSGTAPVSVPTNPKTGLTRFGGWDFRCKCSTNTSVSPPVETCIGCPLLYKILGQSYASPDVDKYGRTSVLNEDEAFDLNRNDDFTDDPQAVSVTGSGKPARTDMSWHWTAVKGIAETGIVTDNENSVFPVYDIDNDRQDETIFYNPVYDGNGIMTSVRVKDDQDGDIDLTFDGNSWEKPGLMSEMAIYTRIKKAKDGSPGTYLQIKEGKLYNSDGTYVRSASNKDQAEMIQRMFRLSNNTGRLCDGAGSAVDPANTHVEACSNPNNAADNCFYGSKFVKTCFDTNKKILYIRSRILDKRGNAWKTDISNALP